jgi:hypothetical protein
MKNRGDTVPRAEVEFLLRHRAVPYNGLAPEYSILFFLPVLPTHPKLLSTMTIFTHPLSKMALNSDNNTPTGPFFLSHILLPPSKVATMQTLSLSI